MNALKKNAVLNQQCLRNKIEELSPLLLKQFNLGGSNKDKLFQATWSYYASGCQERLTSIRRRIEQNARIVAPTVGPRTQIHKNLNISLYESSLPPGVDLEDHIYNELVSCFRCSDEDPAKAKVRKEPNPVQPEQWNLWKREELEVRQMLKQTMNPYLQEELKRRLQKLTKLTNRHLSMKLQSQSIFNNPKYAYISKRYTNARLSNNEKPIKLKPSKASLTKKFPKMSEESKFREERSSTQVKNHRSILKSKSQKSLESEVRENKSDVKVKIKVQRDEQQNADKIPRLPKDSIKENMKYADVETIRKPTMQTSSSDAWQSLSPAQSSLSFLGNKGSIKSGTRSTLIKDKYLKSSRISRMGSIKRSYSWHSRNPANTFVPFRANREGVKPAPLGTYIRSLLSENSRVGAIKKSQSWHSGNPAETYSSLKANKYNTKPAAPHLAKSPETYIPFKAKRPRSKPSTRGKNIRPPMKAESSPKVSIKKANSGKIKSIDKYDWPLPVGLSHMEYFKSFDHSKAKGHKTKVQTFPKIAFCEEPKSTITEPLDEEKPSRVGSPSLSNRYMQSDKNSYSFAKTTPSSRISNEEIKLPPPLIVADVIIEVLKEYGSEITFKDPFTNFMKPNKLDRCYPEKTIAKPQSRRVKVKKIKPNKNMVCKKVQTKPSKCLPPTCSLCQIMRRRHSELRPYMKEMQRERQRMELKAYYNQMIRKEISQGRSQKPDNPAFSRASAREALTRCYESLKLCQEVLEQRLPKSLIECQS